MPATLARPVRSGMIGRPRWCPNEPQAKTTVRQIDSAPLVSDLRNWFVGHVIAAEGVREGVLADFGFAISQNGCLRPS